MIAGKERSTATGKGRSAGGAFALPVSPQGKEVCAVALMNATRAGPNTVSGAKSHPPQWPSRSLNRRMPPSHVLPQPTSEISRASTLRP